MTKEMILHAKSAPPEALATVLGVTPAQLMTQAVEIANTLTRVLREKGMTRRFGAGEHVQVEGWQLAGSLLGFVAREKGKPVELPDGSFEAEAELYNPSSGKVFTHASGYCGTDEPSWKSKPKYARRGMAVTRSINRVYANNFRWLIKLAGFETTPAEEMTDVGIKEAARPAPAAEVPTFDVHDAQQRAKMISALSDLDVPKDDWEAVATLMIGRPFTPKALKETIANFKATQI